MILSESWKIICKMDLGLIWAAFSDTEYSQTSNISCIEKGNKLVEHTDVVGSSTVGAAPTTSSFLT